MKTRAHLLSVGDKFRFPAQSEVYQVTSIWEAPDARLYYKALGYTGAHRLRMQLSGSRSPFVEKVGDE